MFELVSHVDFALKMFDKPEMQYIQPNVPMGLQKGQDNI